MTNMSASLYEHEDFQENYCVVMQAPSTVSDKLMWHNQYGYWSLAGNNGVNDVFQMLGIKKCLENFKSKKEEITCNPISRNRNLLANHLLSEAWKQRVDEGG